jgi:hypothetical protein
MKSPLSFLPLLALSPLGYFLGEYLDGAGVLPRGTGLLVSGFCALILPWPVAAAFALNARTRWAMRLALFICALLFQPFLLFTFMPPGVTSEMMGIAHRFRNEFSCDQLRDCSTRIRQKFHDGELKVSSRDTDDHFIVAQDALVISDTELPESLRGRFQRVFIQKSPVTGEVQVVFALGSATGIICDSRTHVHEFFVCSMADGVHAYRYQRL